MKFNIKGVIPVRWNVPQFLICRKKFMQKMTQSGSNGQGQNDGDKNWLVDQAEIEPEPLRTFIRT